jgi:demethylmenaquinone methyltransferase/2-methoxy-6-polyprenyl-1,4-benzoquinol methylase
MSKSLPHDHIIPFQDSEKSKQEQVADMFDQIAGRYDFMNRFLSAGTDIGWRKKAIRLLKPASPKVILDVATGTADMAIMATRMLKPDRVEGIDISAEMLEVGRKKIDRESLGEKIHLQVGDSETINFAENTFDAVLAAFGVRNFENLEKGLSEMLRVLKPGGQLVILEFSKPQLPGVKGIYNLYMRVVAPGIARMFRQNRQAYKYLQESSNAFPDRQSFTDILNKIGYSDTRFKSLSLGICCIYTGRKKI